MHTSVSCFIASGLLDPVIWAGEGGRRGSGGLDGVRETSVGMSHCSAEGGGERSYCVCGRVGLESPQSDLPVTRPGSNKNILSARTR